MSAWCPLHRNFNSVDLSPITFTLRFEKPFFDFLGCCQRLTYFPDDELNLSAPREPPPEVKLDLSSAGPTVVLLKNCLRICGHGCARSVVPILQDKAYFEVKIQCTGRWAVGLCSSKTPLSSVENLGIDKASWVVREDSCVWYSGVKLARLKTPLEEGNVLGLTYDHVELRFYVNGAATGLINEQSAQSMEGWTGMKGVLYPVVGVAENAVLDVGFNRKHFYFAPPQPDFKEILFEKELL
ncbi:hypothetical protein CRM22_008282 [Opisthorchis felineus]|uniref:SPRY domain-containing protein 7 n=1 Tax=Opisthorchis felineus TaxID=147828 RepID=A0A4S2LJT7_OPIFE|nr:hypothetical protein CRM22_008282 [Opisthorchis felineus]